MIARMLLVLLVVLNLGVAAWWALHRAAPPPASPPLDRAIPTLELMRGADAAPRTNVATSPIESPIPEPAPPTVATIEPDAAAPAAPPSAPVCARFGPYTDEASAQTARGRLVMPGVQAAVRSVGNTNARGYNVFMSPLATREAAVAMAERLRAAGFNDLVLRNEGEAANGIALGRFGSETNARRHQAALQAKGFSAEVAPVGGDAAAVRYWLEVTAPAGFDINAQRARVGAAQGQARNCAV